MNCNDCCYNLPKDGHSYCTYEEGECVKISVLEKENAELKREVKNNEDLATVAYMQGASRNKAKLDEARHEKVIAEKENKV